MGSREFKLTSGGGIAACACGWLLPQDFTLTVPSGKLQPGDCEVVLLCPCCGRQFEHTSIAVVGAKNAQ